MKNASTPASPSAAAPAREASHSLKESAQKVGNAAQEPSLKHL